MSPFNLKLLQTHLLISIFEGQPTSFQPRLAPADSFQPPCGRFNEAEQCRAKGKAMIIDRVDPSPATSCVSSDDEDNQLRYDGRGPKAGKPLVLVGCQRCLMYMMLAHDESKCPKCAGSVLLEFSSNGGFRLTNRRVNKNR